MSDGMFSVTTTTEEGISLRDWFAGMAMQGVLASDCEHTYEELAQVAYVQADAMIEEGAKNGSRS